MSFKEKNFIELINVALKHKATDVHVRCDEKPCFRIRGRITPIQTNDFTFEDIKSLVEILTAKRKVKVNFSDLDEYDGSYEIEDVVRLRYNILKYSGKFGIIMRLVSLQIPDFSELRLPPIIKKLALTSRGLILVTGATGAGKSSTLAAMIDYINEKKRKHIITLEDPIEFLHVQKNSRITQREIGLDTAGFAPALRAALRQDPDIILVGEMRDTETMSVALKAAETGHTVFSTVHTTDALSTIGRLISMFSAEEQNNVRKRLADALYATISQRLLPAGDGKSILPALEIMVNSPGIRECILGKEDLIQIYTYIRKGKGETGSQSFDQHITDLFKAGEINKSVAEEAASSDDFIKKIIFNG